MATVSEFSSTIQNGYAFKGEKALLGKGFFEGSAVPGAAVYLPLKTMNRHGLIAGATGTGKTKTLQVISEILSDHSVPVLLMDIKGDLSGLAAPGVLNDKIKERCAALELDWQPAAYPVELLTLNSDRGVQLRATVLEFGPILLSKILGLNDTQAGLVSMLFKYCDDQGYPLIDLKDFTKLLQYAGAEGKAELEKEYGKISTTSTGTILRKVIELQQQGADVFFGEKSFDTEDLMRVADDGRGMISILRVTEMQDRPKLFSTFMLQLLAELYATLPEAGDLDVPKLVLFIDEAHLVFQEASDALLQQLETVIKLIRSKGVGIFFCTQNPQDIPAPILSQLGLKIQHALRAFTAADRKTIKTAAENFPETPFYTTDALLTQLGIGEALVTLLNEKGIPTPLVHVGLCTPRSRMDVLTDAEINQVLAQSKISSAYEAVLDSESAYEILTAKIAAAAAAKAGATAAASSEKPSAKATREADAEPSFFDHPAVRQATRTAASVLTRSLLGALGLGSSRSRKR